MQKAYAFEIQDVPVMSDYLEVRYSVSKQFFVFLHANYKHFGIIFFAFITQFFPLNALFKLSRIIFGFSLLRLNMLSCLQISQEKHLAMCLVQIHQGNNISLDK